MSEYMDGNLSNLIIQYRNKPKAIATIEAITLECETVFDVLNKFNDAFDLDFAVAALICNPTSASGSQLTESVVGLFPRFGAKSVPVFAL